VVGVKRVHHEPVLLTLHPSLLLGSGANIGTVAGGTCRFEHQYEGPGSPGASAHFVIRTVDYSRSLTELTLEREPFVALSSLTHGANGRLQLLPN